MIHKLIKYPLFFGVVLTVNDESELETLIIHFYGNKGVIDYGKRFLDCRILGEYDWTSLYHQLDSKSRLLFSPTYIKMIQEYERLLSQYSSFNEEISDDLLKDITIAVGSGRLNLKAALPHIYDYVEKRTFEKISISSHHTMINHLAAAGKELPSPIWRKLYKSQPNHYKAHLHMAIIYADRDLAEELLPDLKVRVDNINNGNNIYLRNVFSTIRHKYNPKNIPEKEAVVRKVLSLYASREEWVNSKFGKGFTKKGIQTYFGS